MHKSITLERVEKAVRKAQRSVDYFPGFCKNCGKAANNCEPDARNYYCERCKQNEVFGAEELLMEIV